MTKREAQRLVKRSGRRVKFHWQGSDLIRSCWDEQVKAWRESTAGNCYDCTARKAEEAAWIAEAADLG